ncbi:MAG TPA: hypothetical protein VFX78_04825 [Candidatus Eisenbacteria bacterium]|nr:hypothetical protein [Candidatus Eisenbacteria bacterium]
MRIAWALLLVTTLAAGSEEPLSPELPLRNVELVDREGVATRLVGFYRISGEDVFRGFLGAAEIQVPYERIVELRVRPGQPGGRMRAQITLRSGNGVDATFDEREGEQMLSGYAPFGRLTIFFRDVRQLRILGHTAREDLPDYGPPVEGLDVRVTDGEGVATELIGFRRAVGEDVIPGTRGAASIAIPLRVVRRLEIAADKEPGLRATATLKDGSSLDFRLPTYVEETAYRGEAEFGVFRIRLGKVRSLVVRRETPVLREIEPVSADEGESGPGEQPER